MRVRRPRPVFNGLPEEESAWIENYRLLWDARFDALENVVEDMTQREDINGRKSESEAKNSTTVERTSERELVVKRTINGPAHLVFEAWTKPELFKRWWVPKSCGPSLVSCDVDACVGGKYRLVFKNGDSDTMAVFEEADGAVVIITVTFGERSDTALLSIHPSKDALDAAIDSGATAGMPETLAQLDELFATM